MIVESRSKLDDLAPAAVLPALLSMQFPSPMPPVVVLFMSYLFYLLRIKCSRAEILALYRHKMIILISRGRRLK